MLKRECMNLPNWVVFVAVCGLFMASALPASAQIVFDNASFGGGEADGAFDTFSHTIGGGAERMLVVGIGREEGVGTMQELSVTYGGAAMTNIAGAAGRVLTGAIQWTDLYWLDDSGLPAAGAHDVVISGNHELSEQFTAVGAISLENVAQGAPEATANAADAESAGLEDMSAEITTLTDGAWIVDVLGSGFGGTDGTQTRTPTVQTERGTIEAGSNAIVMSTLEVATAGPTTVGYTIQAGGNRTALSVAAFAPGTPPVFSIQPQGATVLIGTSHTFEVALGSPVSPTYQWKRDVGSGEEDLGTASTLEMTNLQESDSGDYWVVITDDGGPYTSDTAVLSVVTSVPTAQTWGLVFAALLLLVSGAYFVRRRVL